MGMLIINLIKPKIPNLPWDVPFNTSMSAGNGDLENESKPLKWV